ncbi:PolC-type DNA polymerase III [Heliophilum fasciatum]|uniref:DNA polymerase III PolC-type n=1 Tax=Heliophilum fasciatum TaxID=35700 RepID=A0A4R2RKV4_9FIRM|nr:PolC-type DNA polymerase III [Heliophilum fasciatum]MCW2277900.1 DNA polymerase-3 subunit alpha (Gram-positive type) [Heliophilum fasciatum]TCP64530.1 DNA polymerase-3 subunit alpha (Gram-positive type) [Heliophilum fasciatum]
MSGLVCDRSAQSPQEVPLLRNDLKVVQVVVLRRQVAWQVHVQAAQPWTEKALQQLETCIRSHVPALSNVFLVMHCTVDNLESLIGPYWECWVCTAVKESNPFVRTTLLGTKRQIKDQKIILALPPAQADFLRSRQCIPELVRFAQQTFGRTIDICLEEVQVADDTEYFEARQQEEKRLLAQVCPLPTEATAKNEAKPVPANGPIYGKAINDGAVAISTIEDEERSVIIQGRVFDLDTREMKSGRRLITFAVTDETNSIAVKVFEGEKEDLLADGRLKKNAWVKVRGSVQMDKYSQELTVLARDIVPAQPVIGRMDQAEQKRIELHAHTKMSTMDAVVSTGELVARAAAWGHAAVAITDHGVVQSFPEAYEAGQKHKIKIIYGVEGYLVEEPPQAGVKFKSYHIILLVKNMTGLKNLYKLITHSHLDYFHRRPRMPRALIEQYREGLIIGSACEAGEVFQALLQEKTPDELAAIASFYDYLEIQPIGNNQFLVRNGQVTDEQGLRCLNQRIVELGATLQKPVCATGDVHFMDAKDEVFRRILMAGKGFADAEDQPPLYFRTTEEMLEEFAYLNPERAKQVVIDGPAWVADQVEVIKPIPDELYPPIIDGAEEQIREMSENKAAELYGATLPEPVRKRLDKELNSIITHGFSVLYLIAHKLVKKSNDDGYLVGSRGSVGSSLVATFTGITEVNPLPPHYRCMHCLYSDFIMDGSYACGADLPDRDCPTCGKPLIKDGHDIPFETFLGFEGDKVPDIDLNFSGDYQPRAHKYTEELFGKDYVFRAGTISTIAERTAFGFVKNYVDEKKHKVRSAELSRLVSGCSGVKRTTGQHPGGLMVVPRDEDIHNFTPLQRPADDTKSDTITTHFDYHSISSRLVKLDILGHDDPTVIRMLEDLTGVDAKQIPLDESKTMSLFSSTEALGVTPEQIRSNTGTYGIPEFGTKFVRQMLEDTKPKTFSELVRISGFSHGTDVWLNNAQDLIRNKICRVNDAISTRDDIMVYLIYQGLPPKKAFSIMEGVRKGKGVKPDDEALMREHKVPDWYIDSCKKIKYMFPKAHAVAYVTMAFRIAYFKVYYPLAFYASFFTVRADEFDADLICGGASHVRRLIEDIDRKGNEASTKEKTMLTILEMALEMYERGFQMHRVDLQRSHASKFLIEGNGLRPPLGGLPGVGVAAAQNIMQARDEAPVISIEDLRIRSRSSKTVIEALEKHGALEGLCLTDQICLF